MPKLLITFGCSWMHGIGAGFVKHMTSAQYKDILKDKELCYKNSFRGILCQRLNLVNLNFSSGGSSNQRQFRLAQLFFNSKQWQELKQQHSKVIVLWGITATNRNEMFDVDSGGVYNFTTADNHILSKSYIANSYDHQHEVYMLTQQMMHWDQFFTGQGVDNLWFDTFNHHDYQCISPPSEMSSNDFDCHGVDLLSIGNAAVLDKLIGNNTSPRDLLSQMVIHHGLKEVDNQYHSSMWKEDSNRIQAGVRSGLLNPYSYHPTIDGHTWIADYLQPILDKHTRVV